MGAGATDMTDNTQPEALAFCWATELAMTQQPVTLSVTEAREVSAEMQRLHAENTALQAGYAAARLEIESLRSVLREIAEWKSHDIQLAVDHGSNGVRDFYRDKAERTLYTSPQQETQEPVAWYVTGCGRLLDEYEAEAEARRIGGTAKAMPLYTAPQQEPGKAVHQFRKQHCAEWYDGHADHGDGRGPYEERTLYTSPQQEAQEPVAWRELCRRLYVELFYCNQQMTSGERPKWRQGKTVRDVLADAKAALDAAPQPSPASQGDALDAARYRWLREQPFDTWKRIAWNTWNNDPVVWPDRDAAIDAARAAHQEGANHD